MWETVKNKQDSIWLKDLSAICPEYYTLFGINNGRLGAKSRIGMCQETL